MLCLCRHCTQHLLQEGACQHSLCPIGSEGAHLCIDHLLQEHVHQRGEAGGQHNLQGLLLLWSRGRQLAQHLKQDAEEAQHHLALLHGQHLERVGSVCERQKVSLQMQVAVSCKEGM